jgi:hypothetical protein
MPSAHKCGISTGSGGPQSIPQLHGFSGTPGSQMASPQDCAMATVDDPIKGPQETIIAVIISSLAYLYIGEFS